MIRSIEHATHRALPHGFRQRRMEFTPHDSELIHFGLEMRRRLRGRVKCDRLTLG